MDECTGFWWRQSAIFILFLLVSPQQTDIIVVLPLLPRGRVRLVGKFLVCAGQSNVRWIQRINQFKNRQWCLVIKNRPLFRLSWALNSWQYGGFCTAALRAFTNVKRLLVFVPSGTQPKRLSWRIYFSVWHREKNQNGPWLQPAKAISALQL